MEQDTWKDILKEINASDDKSLSFNEYEAVI